MKSRVAADTLRDLQRVTDAALAYLPLDELLAELLARVVAILDADTAAILMLADDDRTLVATAAKGLEEEVERGVRIPVGKGFAGRIASTRRPVQIADLETADVLNPILREKGLRSLLGVPLLVEGAVIGVLHVGTLQHRSFDEDDVDLLQSAADRAALAIFSRVTERERGLADALQSSLLPRLPDLPAVALAGRYLPRHRLSWGATGTTPSRCRTAGSAWRSATWSAAASTPRRSWDSCAAVCARTRWTGCHRAPCWSA